MATLSGDVLQDDIAVTIARVTATANKRARELGVDVLQSFITITQKVDNDVFWRVNYGPRDYINQRGGDLMVDVNDKDLNIKQVLKGQ
ncbi:MAG TPA: hypothetical protein PLA27_02625 [Anaerolineales bacterium]|jgi:hypothetical protein|nr:hypothetical protein [Anaerolineales bacterium]